MDTQSLSDFLLWCTLINGGLLIFWSVFFILAPELTYRLQSKWINISREQFTIAMYGFLGLFKIFFIIFNLVPYIALNLIH